MQNGARGTIDLDDLGALEVIASASNAGIFELARRFRGGASLPELASASGLDHASVSKAIDALLSVGLLRRIKSRGDRPIRYAATAQRIMVIADPSRDDHGERLRDHFRRATAGLLEALSQSEHGVGRVRPGEHRLHYRATDELLPTEWVEFKRRLRELLDYLDHLTATRGNSKPGTQQLCTHGISLQLAPLPCPMLPTPVIRVIPRARAHAPQHEAQPDLADQLTPRESEIVLMRASGAKRPDIARRLNVSVNTVSTLLRRAYAKLGVHNRKQLLDRLSRTPIHSEAPSRER
jgi:DNA-binding CsgD family transcriptional regulator/DNA-binding MarR family transcriptional regulator